MGWEDVLDQRAKQDPYMRAQSDPGPDTTSLVPDTAPVPSTTDATSKALYSSATDTATPPTSSAAVPSKARQNLDSALDRVYEINSIRDKAGLLAHYDKNPDSIGKNIGKSMAFALKGASPILMDKNVDNKTALGYTIGAAMGGALKGWMNPAADEEEMRRYDQQDAYGELDAAKQAYGVENSIAMQELNRKDTESQIAYRDATGKAALGRVENAADKNDIDLLKGLVNGVAKGVISREDGNKQFAQRLSSLAGVPITIDKFDPNKDAIKSYRTIQDAEGNRAIQAIVFKDGRTEYRDVLDPKTGQPAFIKSDRVKQAEIQGNTQIQNTNARILSSEKIAKMVDDTRRYMISMNASEADLKAVESDINAAMLGDPSGDTIVKSYMNKSGDTRDISELTEQEKMDRLNRYWKMMATMRGQQKSFIQSQK